MAPGGGAFYQISPDVALTTCIQITQKVPEKQFFGLQKHVLWIQRPQNREGPQENIIERLIYLFFPKNGPGRGGAFYQISLVVALTTCIQLYSKRTQKAICRTP